jgi:hypothetical protein
MKTTMFLKTDKIKKDVETSKLSHNTKKLCQIFLRLSLSQQGVSKKSYKIFSHEIF